MGWYCNATVFTTFQPFEHIPVLQKENGISRYIIKAPSDQAVLLPVDARVITIPRAQDIKNFFGQSNVWYGDAKNEDVQKFVHTITNYIEQYEKESILEDLKNKQSYAKDQERKVKVEQAAIRTSICYFEQLGYAVRSVEKDNCDWDLEAEAGRTSLRIEVKGLSGDVFNIGLTPNEYKAFEKKSDDYRLSVVTNALKEPKLFICRFSEEQNGWIAETEGESPKKLNIELINSASISY